MIRINDLSKEYITKKGLVMGVDRVNLTISEGEVFGIVGYSGVARVRYYVVSTYSKANEWPD